MTGSGLDGEDIVPDALFEYRKWTNTTLPALKPGFSDLRHNVVYDFPVAQTRVATGFKGDGYLGMVQTFDKLRRDVFEQYPRHQATDPVISDQ